MLLFSINVAAVQVDKALLDAIEIVESNANSFAIGDNGKSVGSFQITRAYVDDVNRIYNKKYTYADRYDRAKAREMTILYLTHYGKLYKKKTNRTATYEVLSRIHNGGPYGYLKQSTVGYWNKVRTQIHEHHR